MASFYLVHIRVLLKQDLTEPARSPSTRLPAGKNILDTAGQIPVHRLAVVALGRAFFHGLFQTGSPSGQPWPHGPQLLLDREPGPLPPPSNRTGEKRIVRSRVLTRDRYPSWMQCGGQDQQTLTERTCTRTPWTSGR